MSIIRIQLATDIPDGMPSHYLHSDGNLYFDTNADFDIRTSRSLVNLTDSGTLKRSSAEEFELPISSKNAYFFGRLEIVQDRFLVNVFAGGTWVPLTELIITGINHAEGVYTCELVGDDWYNFLEGTLLAELSLGNFTYTRSAIEATWSGTGLVLFPIINYNYWFGLAEDPQLRYFRWKDLRPLHNWGRLLEAMFAAAGYSFSSPFLLEHPIGSNLYAYLLKPAWGDRFSGQDILEINTGGATTITVPFVDIGSGSSSRNFLFSQGGGAARVQDFQVEGDPRGRKRVGFQTIDIFPGDVGAVLEFNGGTFQVLSNATPLGGGLLIRWALYEGNLLANPYWTSDQSLRLDPNGTYDDRVAFFPEERVKIEGPGLLVFEVVVATSAASSEDIEVSFAFDLGFRRYIPEEGSVVDMARIIDPRHSCLDFLTGVMHYMDGILRIDEYNRTVQLDIPVDALINDFDGSPQLVPGYFTQLSQAVDVRPESLVLEREELDNQYVRLDFENFDDAFNTYKGYEDRFFYVIGQGDDFEEPKRNANPFFAPTLDVRLASQVQNDLEDTAYVPAIWPGGEGIDVFFEEVEPRMLLYYGASDQAMAIAYENSETTDWPYITQMGLGQPPESRIPVSYVLAGQLFYQVNPLRRADSSSYEFLLYIDRDAMYRFDFSRPIVFDYDEGRLVFQPYEITDFSNATFLSTPIKVKRVS